MEKPRKKRPSVCKDCGRPLEHLGGTVGGMQLYGCPNCGVVYYGEP